MTSHWADWLQRERRSKRMNSHLDVTVSHTHTATLCTQLHNEKRERKYGLDHKHIRKTNLSCS